MTTSSISIRGPATALTILAIACAAGVIAYFPPSVDAPWLVALVTLLFLAILSAYFALTVTEGGASTSVEFLAHLAAVVLLGPAGAIILTVVELLLTEFVVLKKRFDRALFNFSQVVLATTVAAVVFQLFGGLPSLDVLDFRASFPPFVVAALAYWAVNSVCASYGLSVIERRPALEVWRQVMGVVIVFDVVMSTLAYLIAILYVRWGPVSLLVAIVPMIGLRYSYGVNIQLQQLNQDLLRVLIKTLEARDKYTSGHSVRVSERSRKIAEQMGVRGPHLRLIETGALLHDIGKIDLAYSEILRQTGPLTPEQRKLIHSHPDKGVEIMKSVRSLSPKILECIRHHHEWFDGSGYPTGMAGEDIPVGARIIMISDSIDAMMTDRPYRKALSVEDVRGELLRHSGKQFDPVVVEAVLAAGVLEEAEQAAAD